MRTLVFILSFIHAITSWSQGGYTVNDFEFEKVELKYDEGLRDIVSIYILVQDEDGIIWIGSIDGIYRFNGFSAHNISEYINNNQGNVLASRWITSLTIDEVNNRIFVGTTGGAYVINKNSLECQKIDFVDVESKETAFINDINIIGNSLYISTRDGVFLVERSSLKQVSSLFANGQDVPYLNGTTSHSGHSMRLEDTSQVVITSRTGLIKIDNKLKSIDTLSYPFCEQYEHGQFEVDTLGDYFVLSDYNHGIVLYDRSKGEYIKLKRRKRNDWFRLKSMVYIGESTYLVNAENKGIGLYNIFKRSYDWIESESQVKSGMYNLMKDRNGFIWFATRGEIYKSKTTIGNTGKFDVQNIDISNAFANKRKVWSATDSTFLASAGENENNFEIHFHPTPGIEQGVASYSYTKNSEQPIEIEDKYRLLLYDLPPGENHVVIKGIMKNGEEITSKPLLINIHQPFYKSIGFLSALVLSLLGLIYIIYRYNKYQYIQKEKIKSSYERKLAQLENQALRSQINPHFIFNTLNSIKYYSIRKTAAETSDFISTFSILIRRILENSKKTLITLEEEIITLKTYAEIESLRFHDGFKYQFYVDPKISTREFLIPHMIIQPFVENAIWHGLIHKATDRLLTIKILAQTNGVVCQVKDNGIGREASKKIKGTQPHKSSLGMKITQERMDLINEKNQMKTGIEIVDLYDDLNQPAGTQVDITFKFEL